MLTELLNSSLTHNEIIKGLNLTVSKRKMSEARRGYSPAKEEVLSALKQLDPEYQQKLAALLDMSKLYGAAKSIIDRGERLLSMEPLAHRDKYLDLYKEYIDLKVTYNKMGGTPSNHEQLLAVHKRVRSQHKAFLDVLRKTMPEMSETIQTGK